MGVDLLNLRHASSRVDLVLLHRAPVLGIEFRPLQAELGTAVALPDGTSAASLGATAVERSVRATARGVPPSGPGSKEATLGVGSADAARGHLLARHEAHQADQDGADLPGGVEALGVEVGDAEAEARRGLEATGGRVHADGGRGERIVGREHQGAPVLTAVIRGAGRTRENVVPFEDVVLGRVCDDKGRRVL